MLCLNGKLFTLTDAPMTALSTSAANLKTSTLKSIEIHVNIWQTLLRTPNKPNPRDTPNEIAAGFLHKLQVGINIFSPKTFLRKFLYSPKQKVQPKEINFLVIY